MLKTIFKGGLNTNEIDIPTTLDNAQTYMNGVFEGFGKDFTTVKWDTPDYNKLLHLEKNVYQFSGAKNWQQKRDLTDIVKNLPQGAGFKEFRDKAIPVLEEYQGQWLKTEYNAAIAGAQMASKWTEFEKHPDSLLEYRTMEDTRVRPEHASLNNITRPVNDPFWNTYFPPNGWNCRCTIIRLNSGTPTPDKELPYPDVPRPFRTNLAKTGMVLPTDIISIGVPKEAIKQAESLIPAHAHGKDVPKPAPKPAAGHDIIHESKTGGRVKQYPGVNTKSPDHKLITAIAKEYADKGHKVEILPELNENDPRRETLLKGAKKNKNPDLRINGQYVEVKQPLTPYSKNTISNNIKNAQRQADHIIIDLKETLPTPELKTIAKGRMKTHPDIQSITFRRHGKYLRIARNKKRRS